MYLMISFPQMILSLEKESSRTSSFDIDGLILMIVYEIDTINSYWISKFDECQFDICIVFDIDSISY